MKINPILACDFYKTAHFPMWPKGTEYVYSNFTPRSSKLAPKHDSVFDDTVVFFGLQGFIQWFLIDTFNDNFFKQPKEKVVSKYVNTMKKSLCLDTFDASHIEALHDLGYLPIEIKALPEGSIVPMKVPMFTIKNTVSGFGWLVGYLEDMFSCGVWKSCTTATTARQYRLLLEKYAKETGANTDFILWQGHDFAMRGQSGVDDAAASSSGHLLSFLGTDTILAIGYMEDYYGGNDTFVGGSVPASEHSVMAANILTIDPKDLGNAEYLTIKRLITEIYPSGVVSIVSDTFDFWNTISVIAPALKEEILARKENAIGLGKVVFRPDSGDPVDIVCGIDVTDIPSKYATTLEKCEYYMQGYLVNIVRDSTEHAEEGVYDTFGFFKFEGKTYRIDVSINWNRHDKQFYYIDDSEVIGCYEVTFAAEQKGAVETLWDTFGGTVNAEGYKELNPRVGLIYGDSITLKRADDILRKLKDKGFASSNIVFGIGSYTYQYVTRDCYGFAMKATYCTVDGVNSDLYKDPKTSDGTKKSAKGLLRVELVKGVYTLYDQQTAKQEASGALQTVFKDSQLVKFQTIDQIRKVLWK
jgi:nicotinamide phosphoribosyltransferase